MKVDLSIIIVNWNTRELLKQCLASIDYPAEIIVVDNGSTDGSREMISDQWLMVKLIANNKNLGFAKANNQGIKIAKGEFILLLNSDTKIKSNSLKKLITFAKRKKDWGVVGPRLLNQDGSIQFSCFHFPSIKGAFEQFWLGKIGAFEKFAPKGKKETEVEAVAGAAFLIPRKVIARVGLLDERYFFYFEDLDYCRRVKKAGLKVYYLPEAEIIHFHGSSAQKKGKAANKWLIKSSKAYHGLIKHYLINLILWSGQKWQKLKNCC